MALALEEIPSHLVAALRKRSNSEWGNKEWLTRTSYLRIASYAVPKNDNAANPDLKNLRLHNVLYGGALWQHGVPDTAASRNTFSYTYDGSYHNPTSIDDPKLAGIIDHIPGGDIPRPYSPVPGVMSLNVSNKGSYGSLREVKFQIKAFDLAQLEVLEALYMTPGIGLIVEWGWSVMGNNNTALIALDDTTLKDMKGCQEKIQEKVRASDGLYDACVATITNYNWTANKDGSFDIQVEAVSRGETMLNLPIRKANSKLLHLISNLVYDPLNKGEAKKSQDRGSTNELNLPVFYYDYAKAFKGAAKAKADEDAKSIRRKINNLEKENDKIKKDNEYANQIWFYQVTNALESGRMRSLEHNTLDGEVTRISDIKDTNDLWLRFVSEAESGGGRLLTWRYLYRAGNTVVNNPSDPGGILSGINRVGAWYMPSWTCNVPFGPLSAMMDDPDFWEPDYGGEQPKNSSAEDGLLQSNIDRIDADLVSRITTKLSDGLWDVNGDVYRPFYISDWFIDDGKDGRYDDRDKNRLFQKDGLSKLKTAKAVNSETASVPGISGTITDAKKFTTSLKDQTAGTNFYGNMPIRGELGPKMETDASVWSVPQNLKKANTSKEIDMLEKTNFGKISDISTGTDQKRTLIEWYHRGLYDSGGLMKLPMLIWQDSTSKDSQGRGQRYILWAYVDMQKVDPETGEFVSLKQLQEARETAAEQNKQMLEENERKIDQYRDDLKKINESDNRIKRMIGEYLPIWAIETMLNESTNLTVSNQKVYRFDSGFLKYDNASKPSPPGPEEKLRILREYSDLFNFDKDNGWPNKACFGEHGYERFKKYFAGTTGDDLSTEIWQPIRSLPVKISNHINLQSVNPDICLLPGQEDTMSTEEELQVSIQGSKKDLLQQMDWGQRDIKPDKALWEGLVVSDIPAEKPNPFCHGSTTEVFLENRKSWGYVSNILVHTDVVKEATAAQNVIGFYNHILGKISQACGGIWDLGVFIDADKDWLGHIVDTSWAKDVHKTKDNIYHFALRSKNPLIRDFNLQSNIPNSMAMMAMYGTNADDLNQTLLEDNVWGMQGPSAMRWQDLALKNIQFQDQTTTLGKSDDPEETFTFKSTANIQLEEAAQEDIAEDRIPDTYPEQVKLLESRLQYIHENGMNTHEFGNDRDNSSDLFALDALKCLEAILNNKNVLDQDDWDEITSSQEYIDADEETKHELLRGKNLQKLKETNPGLFKNIIPLVCSITLDGISGITYGHSFGLIGLPKRYQGETCFQITNASHTIDFNGWTVVYTGQMRRVPEGSTLALINPTDTTSGKVVDDPGGPGVALNDIGLDELWQNMV